MFKNDNMYEINDDMPSENEMNSIIDEERIADYEQCEFVCSCGNKFNTEEGIIDDAGNVSCKGCGEIVLCDEMDVDNEGGV